MSELQHQSPMFATSWPGFHKFSRGSSLMTFFTSSPPVVGLAIFVSTILNYGELVYDYNHNIYASNNAFINQYRLLVLTQKNLLFIINHNQAYSYLKKYFCSLLTRTRHTHACERIPSILMLMNKNQAYYCFCVRTKHTHAYVIEQSILMLMRQNQAYSCLCGRTKHTHAYEQEPSILMLM